MTIHGPDDHGCDSSTGRGAWSVSWYRSSPTRSRITLIPITLFRRPWPGQRARCFGRGCRRRDRGFAAARSPRFGPAAGARSRWVRLRTKPTLGPGSRAAGLAMAFKLLEAAQDRWRAVNSPHLVALVRAGATFRKGVLVERPTETEAANREKEKVAA